MNFNASGFASGMYFYKFTSNEFTDTRKLIIVK
ncbi:MAG: T9SS type A sorting domain-containing protein [Ignavibacteria bacterium]|nr:T9SS type A sorting domain-containing protein [Ignavibacteria bacterium]MCC7159355.1 T9SS type A sorting domain-containing protein [Ignavibacteria bacterium]